MAKTVFTGNHKVMIDLLIEARKEAGLKQTDLATRLGKDQPWVSLVENYQRRLDLLEYVAIIRAIGADPKVIIDKLLAKLPKDIEI